MLSDKNIIFLEAFSGLGCLPQCCLSVEGVELGVEAKGFNLELRAGGNGFPGTDPRVEVESGRMAHHCLSFMKIRMLGP